MDLARLKIIQSGITVSNPSQFLDIGYLCHLTDPEGRSIELLQHSFAENFIKPEEKVGMTLNQYVISKREVFWSENGTRTKSESISFVNNWLECFKINT